MKWLIESQLCEAFKPTALQKGWMLHGETHDFDMMFEDQEGRRLGVQAKIGNGNLAATQCTEGLKAGNADAAAILVPYAGQDLRRRCEADGLGVFTPIGEPDEEGFQRFWLKLPRFPQEQGTQCKRPLPRHARSKSKCGVPSPKQLTPTREKELRLCGIIRRRGGFATSKDVQSCGLVRRFWSPSWIRFTGGVYKPIPGMTMPDEDEEFKDVAEKYAEEMA